MNEAAGSISNIASLLRYYPQTCLIFSISNDQEKRSTAWGQDIPHMVVLNNNDFLSTYSHIFSQNVPHRVMSRAHECIRPAEREGKTEEHFLSHSNISSSKQKRKGWKQICVKYNFKIRLLRLLHTKEICIALNWRWKSTRTFGLTSGLLQLGTGSSSVGKKKM